jgi:hypothetical protein
MATCDGEVSFATLELPREFEELQGLLEADLQAIVRMLTERAHERLFLTRREFSQLQASLWNGLTETLNTTMEPLSADRR